MSITTPATCQKAYLGIEYNPGKYFNFFKDSHFADAYKEATRQALHSQKPIGQNPNRFLNSDLEYGSLPGDKPVFGPLLGNLELVTNNPKTHEFFKKLFEKLNRDLGTTQELDQRGYVTEQL